ncbi:DNA circularization N-terminal domain-containing protein [Chromobacterium vaccinii]|uniref:DNA circularization protein n=1 Tax=Chromobacterium vaccinii TaxID=1108595 RepID=UPI0031D48D3B
MAWDKTLLDASWRGVKFDCVKTQDSAQRATASHEYPYLDGADVEDLGRRARRVQISAVFVGNDYENRLQAFLQELDKPGPGELIHPVFGSIKHAQLLDYDVVHEADSRDYCQVGLVFVEATPGNPFFVQQLPAQKAQAISQFTAAAQNQGIEAFALALGAINSANANLARLNGLRNMLTGTLGAIKGQVRGMVGGMLDVLDFPRAFAADVFGAFGGLADLRSFDPAVLMSDWRGLSLQLDDIVKLPRQASNGEIASAGSSGADAPGTGTPGTGGDGGTPGTGTPGSGGDPGTGGTPGNPGTLPVIISARPLPAYPADVDLVEAVLQVGTATTKADTAGEILAAEADQPVLSPAEVEQIANDTRSSVQDAIDAIRATLPMEQARTVVEALKDVASSVQEAAEVVIAARPPLQTRAVEAPGNLHLVAFRWYGDYTRAQELARLNPQLRNPNAIATGDILHAYAR